jgi:hypothetical protein
MKMHHFLLIAFSISLFIWILSRAGGARLRYVSYRFLPLWMHVLVLASGAITILFSVLLLISIIFKLANDRMFEQALEFDLIMISMLITFVVITANLRFFKSSGGKHANIFQQALVWLSMIPLCVLPLIIGWGIQHFHAGGQIMRMFFIAGRPVFCLVILGIIIDGYLFRRNILNRISGKHVSFVYVPTLKKLEMCYVAGGTSPRTFCSAAFRALSPSSKDFMTVDQLAAPLPSDYPIRVLAYSDINEAYSPWINTDKTGNNPEVDPKLEYQRSLPFAKPLNRLFRTRTMWFLGEIDRKKARQWCGRPADADWRFSRALNSAYLIVDRDITDTALEGFRTVLTMNPAIYAEVIVTDRAVWNTMEVHLDMNKKVPVVFSESSDTKKVRRQIIIEEIARIQRQLQYCSPLEWLLDLELARFNIKKAEKNGPDGISSEEPKKVEQEYLSSLWGHKDVTTMQLALDYIAIPIDLRDLLLEPARDLVTAFARAPGFPTRTYIGFNILDMYARTLMAVTMSCFPRSHPIRTGFPANITGADSAPKDMIVDYTNMISFLLEHLQTLDIGTSDSSASKIKQALDRFLAIEVDPPPRQCLDRFRILFPFAEITDIKTVAGLLRCTVDMRNMVRGHGIVTGLNAAASYPLLAHCLGGVSMALRQMDIVMTKTASGDVMTEFGGVSVQCKPYIIYRENRADYFFLEGLRKGKQVNKARLVYIGYSSGERYRPMEIELDSEG